jgi:hypothetical protein
VAAILLAAAAPAYAHLPMQTNSTRPPVINVVDTGTKIDANQLSFFVTNVGSFAYDLPNQVSGLEFPKGTGNTCVYAAGLWLGAKVAGQTRVTVAEYSQEFTPGPMIGGTFAPDSPRYHVYKVSREDTTGWADWVANAQPDGAPVDTVGGEVVPHIIGDQTLWCVFNDANPSRHTNRDGSSPPLGVEVQLTAFAFNRQGALGNTAFLSYKIINKGSNTLDSSFVSVWSATRRMRARSQFHRRRAICRRISRHRRSLFGIAPASPRRIRGLDRTGAGPVSRRCRSPTRCFP